MWELGSCLSSFGSITKSNSSLSGPMGSIVLQELLDYFDALVVQNAMGYPKLFDAREAEPR